MFALRSLTTQACTAILLITLTGFGEDANSSSTPTTDQLRQVVVAHYRAIEDNRLDEAMGFYHSQSPEISRARENIEFGLSRFLLKTTTMSFCYAGQQGEIAIAMAKHRYLMIAGIKFIEHFVDAEYQFRKQQGSWKIWTQRDNLNDTAEYSVCETGPLSKCNSRPKPSASCV